MFHFGPQVAYTQMLDRVLCAVFDGLMRSRPCCRDMRARLSERSGADQILITGTLVSVACSEPDGEALFLILLWNIYHHSSQRFDVMTTILYEFRPALEALILYNIIHFSLHIIPSGNICIHMSLQIHIDN